MNGAEWLDKNEYEDATRDLMVQAAETCEAARAAGDLDLALGAKAVELRIARMLSLQQHCVVAAAEVLELWPAFARAAERGGDKTERRVIWGMKYAAGAAMDLPEIPLATIDQLVGVLGEMLTFWGKKPWAVWLLEARRAYIAGDRTGLAGYLEKVPPTINQFNTDPECDLFCAPNTMIERAVDVAMSNSFGFGGHNVSLAVRRFLP